MNHKRQSRPETKRPRIQASVASAHDGLQHDHRNELPPLSPKTVFALQRTIGNQAVQRLLMSKNAVPAASDTIVQRFSASEHKRIGDEGSKDASGNLQMVELAPGYSISYGDMVAMAGDHFTDIEEMRKFARNKGKGPGTRGEIEYVLWDIHGKPAPKPKTWDAKAEEAADKRYYALAMDNRSHFLNPAAGDESRTNVEKANDVTKKGAPLNAVAGYSHNHMRAIKEAFEAGKAGKGIEAALAVDAFGAHFLTDAFAGGHLRTPRTSAKDYWDPKMPMFNFNLKGYIAEQLADELHKTKYGGLPSKDAAYEAALGDVTKLVDSKGFITFGGVVAIALHDYDNEKGVMGTVEGRSQPIKFQGDGTLGKTLTKVPGKGGKLVDKWVDKPGFDDQEQVMIEAVKASKDDIVKAWDAGKKSTKKIDLYNLVDALTAAGQGQFQAETLLPKPNLSNQPQWKFPDWEVLFNDKQFQEGVKIFVKEKADEFKKFVASEKDAKKRSAIQNKIINPLEADGIKVIKEVINWVPNTGGGVLGHNQDDNSEDYFERAKKAGALKTLTRDQRQKIVVNLFNGYTSGGDENRCMELLDTASDKDRRWVIQMVTWDRCEDELGGKFSKKYPKAQYGGK